MSYRLGVGLVLTSLTLAADRLRDALHETGQNLRLTKCTKCTLAKCTK